jgi:hypothetical protein
MKVKLRQTMAGDYGTHGAGSVVDLPAPVARHLLETNQADPVETETAALEGGEKAVKPKAKKRQRHGSEDKR